jgi:hypothetical protein
LLLGHLLLHLLLLPKLLLQLRLPLQALLGLLLESPFPFFHLHLCCIVAMSLTLQWKACKEA